MGQHAADWLEGKSIPQGMDILPAVLSSSGALLDAFGWDAVQDAMVPALIAAAAGVGWLAAAARIRRPRYGHRLQR